MGQPYRTPINTPIPTIPQAAPRPMKSRLRFAPRSSSWQKASLAILPYTLEYQAVPLLAHCRVVQAGSRRARETGQAKQARGAVDPSGRGKALYIVWCVGACASICVYVCGLVLSTQQQPTERLTLHTVRARSNPRPLAFSYLSGQNFRIAKCCTSDWLLYFGRAVQNGHGNGFCGWVAAARTPIRKSTVSVICGNVYTIRCSLHVVHPQSPPPTNSSLTCMDRYMPVFPFRPLPFPPFRSAHLRKLFVTSPLRNHHPMSESYVCSYMIFI